MLTLKEMEFIKALGNGNNSVMKIVKVMNLHPFNPVGGNLKKKLISYGLVRELSKKGKEIPLELTGDGMLVLDAIKKFDEVIVRSCEQNALKQARVRKVKVIKSRSEGVVPSETK
jgi:hypothetical protein